ncbi:MAG: hypothetical protein M1814_002158 [Vezdaea aestivalis]|nr:MAG: hypothetical protein M1814_002158 [Vezdaea aestivalis]
MITSVQLADTIIVALAWAGVGVAAVLTGLRLWIRISRLKRLFWDDFWHLVAFALLVASAILYMFMCPPLLGITKFTQTGNFGVVDSHFFANTVPWYLRLQFTSMGLFYSCIWSIKLSFMMFYRRFFKDLRDHMIAWWIILAITLLTYLGAWLCMMYATGRPQNFFNLYSAIQPAGIHGTRISLMVTTSFDVLSDIAIMVLPIRLLYNLRISIRQKLGLGLIFGMVVVIMAVSIARVVIALGAIIGTRSTLGQADPAQLSFWSVIEASIALWVSCLPTFRILFRSNERSSSDMEDFGPSPSDAARHFSSPELARQRIKQGIFSPSRSWNSKNSRYRFVKDISFDSDTSQGDMTLSPLSQSRTPIGWSNYNLDSVVIPSPILVFPLDQDAAGRAIFKFSDGEPYYIHVDEVVEEDEPDYDVTLDETYDQILRSMNRRSIIARPGTAL